MIPDMKVYLGDGAYADFDGYQIWLTAENGIEVTDRIALEPKVFKALLAYHGKIKETFKAQEPHDWAFEGKS